MDSTTTYDRDVLEKQLDDPTAPPICLPMQFLQDITCIFSRERELGRGGYGAVYKGVLRSGKVIAVKKIFDIHLVEDDQFQREVGYLMSTKHQNIVQLVGYCAESKWIAMELPNGNHRMVELPIRLLCFEYLCKESLDKYLSDESVDLDWYTRFEIIKGICSGLHFLHEKYIVHLDLKPENILMDASMMPKVADFGLSRLLGAEKSRTIINDNHAGSRKFASHIVGYPRMGPKRELKFALESFWDGKSTAEDLEKVATDLRASIWKQMADAGIKYIPSNTFSYYDQVLDTTAMVGAVPERYSWTGGEIGFDTYFSMARGYATVPAMYMTKWFDTNYHFIVPELGPNTKFTYSSHKAVNEYKEAKALGVDTVPVLIGPVSYLLLSKPAKGVEKGFPVLSLLSGILPVYKEVIAELKAAGASWIQFDEPALVLDLYSQYLAAFSAAYTELESALLGLNVLIETYFADIPTESYKTLTSLSGVTAYGFDLVRGAQTLELVKSDFPAGKYLFAGVVDGRNIWADDLAASLRTLQSLEAVVGKDKLVVSTSCSLMHTAVDLVNETKLDAEIKSWLAFAAQKVVEVDALAKALAGQKDEVIQIDEAGLRECLPLRRAEQDFYLDWAAHSFRITNCEVKDTTQIHTHMCYSNFNDIINMDADVITNIGTTLESSSPSSVRVQSTIGPGVYDIHSPRINKILGVLDTNNLFVGARKLSGSQ